MRELGGLGIESRFWIQRELGRGAKSLVVDVWDALHDVRRALKIATSRESRSAFEAESGGVAGDSQHRRPRRPLDDG